MGDQLGQRANRVLDRHIRIQPMLEVEIDVIAAETAQQLLASPVDIGGIATGAETFLGADLAEF